MKQMRTFLQPSALPLAKLSLQSGETSTNPPVPSLKPFQVPGHFEVGLLPEGVESLTFWANFENYRPTYLYFAKSMAMTVDFVL